MPNKNLLKRVSDLEATFNHKPRSIFVCVTEADASVESAIERVRLELGIEKIYEEDIVTVLDFLRLLVSHTN